MSGEKQEKNTDNPIIQSTKKLAEKRKFPILILDIETVSPSSVFQVQKELQDKIFPELDVVLHTPGGHIESAFNIVKLLRRHGKKVNIIVPYMAKSAGTLICLGANRLILNTIAELGPLDTQIREAQEGDSEAYKSALNGFQALEQVRTHALENLDIAAKVIVARSGLKMGEAIKLAIEFSGKTSACLYNQLNPMAIGEYARALEVGERYGIEILSRFMGWSPENAINIVRKLVYEYPSHGFIIDAEEITSLGLCAEEAVGEDLKLIERIKDALVQKELGRGGSNIKLLEINHEKRSGKKK